MAQERRKDKTRVVLKTGEGQRNNGTYYYRWQDRKGNRHILSFDLDTIEFILLNLLFLFA